MKNPKQFLLKLFLVIGTLVASSCSPFGNNSLIESVSQIADSIFSNTPQPIKPSFTAGQVIGDAGAGYRMTVGITNTTSRTKTCNSEICMDVGITR